MLTSSVGIVVMKRTAALALSAICLAAMVACDAQKPPPDHRKVRADRVARIFTVIPFGPPSVILGQAAQLIIGSTNLGECKAGKIGITFTPSGGSVSVNYSVANLTLANKSTLDVSVTPLADAPQGSFTFGKSYTGLPIDGNSEIDLPITSGAPQPETFAVAGAIKGAIVVESCNF
jgi:hypothetical protein